MIAGVAGGLGEYLNIDPTVIRVILVVAVFLSFGALILAYIILVFVIPLEPENTRKKVKNSPPS